MLNSPQIDGWEVKCFLNGVGTEKLKIECDFKPKVVVNCFCLSYISDRFGYDITNCSRYWHVFDFDASTAKFKIYQNKLMHSAPILPKKSIVNPNCSCLVKHDISSDDVISSAEKISVTAEDLMVDELCVNEMKNIYDNSSKCLLLA